MYAIKKEITKQRVNKFDLLRVKLSSFKLNIVVVGEVNIYYDSYLSSLIKLFHIKSFSEIYDLNIEQESMIWIIDKDTKIYSKEFLNCIFNTPQSIDMQYFDEEFSFKENIYPYLKPSWSPFYFYFNNIGNAFWVKFKYLVSVKPLDYNALIQSFINLNKNKILYKSQILSSSKVNSLEISNPDNSINLSNQRYSGSNVLVSIIILSKDKLDYLQRLISSIIQLSSYKFYEIIIVDHNSVDDVTISYLNSISIKYPNIHVVKYKDEFNFSKMNNWAVKYTFGEYLVFLNNDIEIIDKDWIQKMLFYASRPEISIVGSKLLYPNNLVQHCGISVGIYSNTGHFQRNTYGSDPGYMNTLKYPREVLAVTGACMMIKKSKFEKVGKFNENFKIIFNDVDICLKSHELGFTNIVLGNLSFIHYEGITRGLNNKVSKKDKELKLFTSLWSKYIKTDPYYNKHFWKGSEGLLVV